MTGAAAESRLLDGFRHYLREGHFLAEAPRLVPLSLALYRRLGGGAPVERAELAVDLNLTAEALNADLRAVPESISLRATSSSSNESATNCVG